MNSKDISTGINIDMRVVLEAISQLDSASLHLFTTEVMKLFLQRIPTEKKEQEWSLIYQIYTIVPPHIQQRYEQLSFKLKSNTLDERERKEFIALNDQMEQFSADRLALLMELATLRKVNVKDVMVQLGIQKPVYV